MNPLWKRILDKELPSDKKQSIAIAENIAHEVKTGTLTIGSPLPPYRMMAAYMNLPHSVLQESFFYLKNSYQLIETRRGGGTRIIFPKHGYEFQEKFKRPDYDKERLLFDYGSMVELDRDSSSFKAKFAEVYTRCAKMSEAELSLKMPAGLLYQIGLLVRNDLGRDFRNDQLLYSDDYELMIYNLCRLFLKKEKVFVMAYSAVNMVERAVITAGKSVAFIKADSSGMLMDELVKLCKSKSPGIVYLSSGAPYPVNWLSDPVKIKQLKDLHNQYHFILLLDNRYTGLMNIPELEMVIKEFNTSFVVYLRPVSLLHRKLNEVNVIAGPKKIISALKKQYVGISRFICPIIAYALWELLELGVVYTYEEKLFGKMLEVIEVAKQVIDQSGLWKEEFIADNKGCFFYLEPKKGTLPDDIYNELVKEQIYTIHQYHNAAESTFGKGVLFSIAAYLNKLRLVPDLSRLIKACEKRLIH